MENDFYIEDDMEDGYDDIPTQSAPDPARNLTVSNFDNETLQYLKDVVKDDTMDFLLNELKKESSKMTVECVNDIEILIRTYFSQEYALTNISKTDTTSRWLDFRVAYMFLKGKTRAINTMGGSFQYIMSLIESKFVNKLSRSVNGFERKTQNTQHVTSTSTRLVGNSQKRTGLGRIGRGAQ